MEIRTNPKLKSTASIDSRILAQTHRLLPYSKIGLMHRFCWSNTFTPLMLWLCEEGDCRYLRKIEMPIKSMQPVELSPLTCLSCLSACLTCLPLVYLHLHHDPETVSTHEQNNGLANDGITWNNNELRHR